MIRTLNVSCVWGGTLAGIVMKNPSWTKTTAKIIGIHGWLDNLNSLFPLAQKLIDHHPNYEIYLYDRAGHGFSDHMAKGSDYSYGCGLRDLRSITQTLGWTKEKYSFIGHSYGAHMAMSYAAAYPEEISCLVALDAILSGERSSKPIWKTIAHRIDGNLEFYKRPVKIRKEELTYDKAMDLVRSSRIGIDDEAAKLLLERSIRRHENNRLHFTRDEALRNFHLIPLNATLADEAIRTIQANILFIGAIKPQWPISKSSIESLKQNNPSFEMSSIEGSHHFHMTHADEVVKRIEEYFQKYLPA